jgi:hypothetical protein
MKNKLTVFLTLSILLTIGSACEFSTTKLAKITFSDSEKSTKTFTSAKQGDKIYALSEIKNVSGIHTVRWKVTDSNGKEIELPKNEMKSEGGRLIYLNLILKSQVFSKGKYNFEVKLLNEKGDKELDTKTGTLEVKE